MTRAQRLRCALRWSGAIAAFLLLSTFMVSIRRYVCWVSPDRGFQAGATLGAITLSWRPPGWLSQNENYPDSSGWSVDRYVWSGDGPEFCWWVQTWQNAYWHNVAIPIWLPFLALAAPTYLLWRHDRRDVRAALRRWFARLTPPRR